GAGAIQINVLRWILPIVGPEPDQVAFIGDNVKQFVLLEEASDGRITLVLLPACLYGDREEIFPSKPEAQKNVSNRVSHPVRSNYVDGVEFPEIKCFVVVARREVGFCAIVKVSDVMDGHQVSIDRRIRQLGILRRPIPVLPRRNHEPPAKHQDEQRRKNQKRATPFGGPKIPSQHDNTKGCKDSGENFSRSLARQVGVVDRESSPGGSRRYQNGNQRS